MLRELQAAATQLAASRDLSAAEAELANANLALLMPAGSAADAPPEGSSGGERQRRHVWYGDPLLNSSDSRHSVAVSRGRLFGGGGEAGTVGAVCRL